MLDESQLDCLLQVSRNKMAQYWCPRLLNRECLLNAGLFYSKCGKKCLGLQLVCRVSAQYIGFS